MTKAFFDHISTTPLDPGVFEAMRPYFLDQYGNPSSHIHDQGQAALRAVDQARGEVAAPGSDTSSCRMSSISP